MEYVINQHVMSQWVLRNFRSDDTANSPKDKKRVWCHTVYLDKKKQNVVKEIPLPISSVGVRKNCFMLEDSVKGERFDIENELSAFERKTSNLFSSFIHKHKFDLLLKVNVKGNALEQVLNFCVIQRVLNLFNPQNKYDDKDSFFQELTKGLLKNIEKVQNTINNPPDHIVPYFENPIFSKIKKVANCNSTEEEKSKALFVLFMLAEAHDLPTLTRFLSTARNELFKDIYITGIYHTGYGFNSTGPRPVFTIGPNVFCYYQDRNLFYLPISHNFALSFTTNINKYYNNDLSIFSPNPQLLGCLFSPNIRIFKVSHDFIDNETSWVNLANLSESSTIYTSHQCSDVEEYLELQQSNKNYYYQPENPVSIGQKKKFKGIIRRYRTR